jgi:hypothetical protein
MGAAAVHSASLGRKAAMDSFSSMSDPKNRAFLLGWSAAYAGGGNSFTFGPEVTKPEGLE